MVGLGNLVLFRTVGGAGGAELRGAFERSFPALSAFRAAWLLAGALLVVPPPVEAEDSWDIESAREACRESRDWPKLPAAVEGCSVDWADPESVAARVVRPSKLTGPPSIRRPTLPADEEVRHGGLLLEYLISEEGEVVDVCVLRSVSMSVDEHFVDMAKQTSFRPARFCDEPVPFSLIVTVDHHAWDWPRE